MNAISVQEIKQRSVIALQEAAKDVGFRVIVSIFQPEATLFTRQGKSCIH